MPIYIPTYTWISITRVWDCPHLHACQCHAKLGIRHPRQADLHFAVQTRPDGLLTPFIHPRTTNTEYAKRERETPGMNKSREFIFFPQAAPCRRAMPSKLQCSLVVAGCTSSSSSSRLSFYGTRWWENSVLIVALQEPPPSNAQKNGVGRWVVVFSWWWWWW